MSKRLRNKDIPNQWYIIIEGEFINKKGKTVHQKAVKFDGSATEADVTDRLLNNREQPTQYPTVLDMIPRFMAAYQNNTRPKTYSAMQSALNHLLPYYGEMRIPLIANHHHESYKTMRLASTYLPGKASQPTSKDTEEETAKRRHPSKLSINRELACLKALLTFAEKQGTIVDSRPDLFSKKHAGGKVIVPIAPSQMIALRDVVKGSHTIPVLLMMYVGLRLNEATSLRCEDIHLENRTMYVTGKGGAKEAIPIPLPLVAHLKKAKAESTTEWIAVNPKTGQPYGDIMKHLNTLCKLAKIDKPITHHTLRHSCASALVLAGVALPRVQGILRHSDISTTMLYVHIAARFGATEETELARQFFWLNKDGIEENPAVDFKALLAKGAMYPDSYKTPAEKTEKLTPFKPA